MQVRLAESRIALEKAITLDPNSELGNKQLAWTLLFLAEPDAAIALGEKNLRLSPRDPLIFGTYQVIGWSHLVSNRVDQAIDLFIKGCTAHPRVWTFYYGLAGAFALKHDLDGAKAALAESLKLRPEVNSLAQWYEYLPWTSKANNQQYWALEDKTLSDGLRRIGFPEKRRSRHHAPPALSTRRAIDQRWTSLGPSEIRNGRTSRNSRATIVSSVMPSPPRIWTLRSTTRQIASEQDGLGHARFVAGAMPLVEQPGGVPNDEAAGVQVHLVVGEHKAHPLVLAQRLAKGGAAAGLIGGDVVGAAGGTEPAHAMRQPRRRQPDLGIAETLADPAEDRALRHP